jgi:hypothetical protein
MRAEEQAQKVRDQLKELSKQNFVPAWSLVWVYMGLGGKDQAFKRCVGGLRLSQRGFGLVT